MRRIRTSALTKASRCLRVAKLRTVHSGDGTIGVWERFHRVRRWRAQRRITFHVDLKSDVDGRTALFTPFAVAQDRLRRARMMDLVESNENEDNKRVYGLRESTC